MPALVTRPAPVRYVLRFFPRSPPCRDRSRLSACNADHCGPRNMPRCNQATDPQSGTFVTSPSANGACVGFICQRLPSAMHRFTSRNTEVSMLREVKRFAVQLLEISLRSSRNNPRRVHTRDDDLTATTHKPALSCGGSLVDSCTRWHLNASYLRGCVPPSRLQREIDSRLERS